MIHGQAVDDREQPGGGAAAAAGLGLVGAGSSSNSASSSCSSGESGGTPAGFRCSSGDVSGGNSNDESSKKLKVERPAAAAAHAHGGDPIRQQQEPLVRSPSGGVAAAILAIPPGGYGYSGAGARDPDGDGGRGPGEGFGRGERGAGAAAGAAVGGRGSGGRGELEELPHSVMQMVATSLQSDLLVAALVQQPFHVAEPVLCVPKGAVTVPVRLTPGVMRAAAACTPVSTEDGVRLPSLLSTVLGARPTRLLATQFQLAAAPEGGRPGGGGGQQHVQGICYALWLDPARVPAAARAGAVMWEAGRSLPLLLAAKVRALCWDRVGRRFDVVLRAMPHALVFVDDGAGPCVVNAAAAELLALVDVDGAGQVDAKVLAAGMCRLADRCTARAYAYRCFKQVAARRDQQFQWDWELTGPPRRVYRVRSYPVSNNATHGRIWFLSDITAEWDARLAVEAAHAAKTRFLAMMSHELRTPMTGVLGMLDLLQHHDASGSLTGEQARFVRVMQGCGQGLVQVLDGILDFSAIRSGKFALEVRDFHVGEMLEQVAALFQPRLAEKKLALTVVMPDSEWLAVRGDERIRQVLNNLVSNAIKFTETGGIHISWQVDSQGAAAHDHGHGNQPAAGPVESSNTPLRPPPDSSVQCAATPQPKSSSSRRPPDLRGLGEAAAAAPGDDTRSSSASGCRQPDSEPPAACQQQQPVWHEVRVQDSGIGLSQEQQGRLFQSFSQADTSTTRKFGGTGLGLAISKGLVTAMGGRIWVESAPGQGSTFAFRIPLQPAPPRAAPQRQSEPSSPSSPSSSAAAAAAVVDSAGKRVTTGGRRSVRVLAAEDDRVSRALLGRMLNIYGHEVQLVANGQLAVEAVQKAHFDMVLMDLQMPVLDGLSATKAIRGLPGPAAKVPIFALTADVLTKEQESLEEMKLDGYLTKPINWESLSAVIDTVVASTSAEVHS